jgi:hypothetical protein
LADFFDLVKRQYTRQDQARQSHAVPDLDVGSVDGVGLHRQVDGQLRPLVAHHHDQAGSAVISASGRIATTGAMSRR